MNFDKLIKRELVAEFIPKVENEGLNNFDAEITSSSAAETIVTKKQQEAVNLKQDQFNEFGFSADAK